MQMIEIRANQVTIDGYVNAVGRYSHPIYSHRKKFIEQILPGTFADALKKNPEVRVLFNHDKNKQIGKNGQNVTLQEDAIGLRVHAIFDDPEVVKAASAGELRGWSFGFVRPHDTWENAEPYDKRSIEALDLTEVSLLTKQPAYLATTAEVRDAGNEHIELRMQDDDCEIRKIDELYGAGSDDKQNYKVYEYEIEMLEKGII